MRVPKYPFSPVDDMDETPAFFDTVSLNCILKKSEKKFLVCSSGSGKKRLTVELSVTSDGEMLPPMNIFKGKTDQTIRKLNIPPAFIVKHKRRLGCITI